MGFKITVRNFGNSLNFKNKIRWDSALSIIFYHLFGIWWCWKYSLPAKYMTVIFACVMFVVSGVGVSCGAHRLFTHKSFKVNNFWKIFFLLSFASAGQNSVYNWVRDHRLHHKFSDTEADPHNASRGLFFSHIGWLMTKKNDEVIKQGRKIDMSDIANDKTIMFFHRHSAIFKLLCCYVIPTLTGIVLWGENWKCAIAWQCFIRYLTVLHAELSVNSISHLYGETPYKNIMPRQNNFVGFVTCGDGSHNYHHTFPYDYKASETYHCFQISTSLIKLLEKGGWVHDLKEATPEVVKATSQKLNDSTQILEN